MNRLNFLRSIAVGVAAAISGKIEDILPEATPDLPGIGMQSFNIWIGPNQFGVFDIIRNNKDEFFIYKKDRNTLFAKHTTEDMEIRLIESEDLKGYSKEVVRLCSAVSENSGSKTSIYGEV